MWEANQKELYYIALDEPSKFLLKYMLEKYQHVWDTEKMWWIPAKNAEYLKAVKEQKEKEANKPKVQKTDETVISVNFNKK